MALRHSPDNSDVLTHHPGHTGDIRIVSSTPCLSSWDENLSLHGLLAFPGFISMALITKRGWLRMLLLGTMVSLLTTGTMLFLNKFWIA